MDEQSSLDDQIQTYYASDFDEDARIQTRSTGGLVELGRVRELVSARLAPASRVLDVGGATGVHARWLAEAGHRVTLVDPVPEQVAKAAAHGTFEAVVGDARHLDLPDGSVDAVLLFGPLYHLSTLADRLKALTEARRVLSPGGLVFAQGISRLAAFADQTLSSGFDVADDAVGLVRTGEWRNPGPGFPGGHFHTAAELGEEVAAAGFVDVTVHGVEGPTLGSLEWFGRDDELLGLGLALARRVEELRDMRRLDAAAIANLSPHVMAIGTRRPPDLVG